MVDFLSTPFIKSSRLDDLPPEAWRIIAGPNAGGGDLAKLYRLVPWLFRGVDIRANAVAAMPFAIRRGDTEIDSSEDYQNAVGFLPNPDMTFGLIESALTMWGKAYLENSRNMIRTKQLPYLLPPTVSPVIDPAKGLTSWRRIVGGEERPMKLQEIVYFWKPDPWVEIGPPTTSPCQAASVAAGVLLNVDQFAQAFFARGAIKGTVLRVTGNPPEEERNRSKTWWGKLFKGIADAWGSAVINAEAVEPVVVGEGLESLSNNALTEEKRRDVAGALGIPMSLLFSDAANYATAQEDNKHFYSKTIVPDCRLIQAALNEQVFRPAGYTLQFTPENLDLFQEDENERATSLASMVNALSSPEEFLIASQILGYEIDDDVRAEIEKLIAGKEQRRQEMAAQLGSAGQPTDGEGEDDEDEQPMPPGQQPPQRDDMQREMRAWRRYASKRAGKSGREFQPEHVPASMAGAIAGALEGAKSAEDVHVIFDDAESWEAYP